jgi:hypothetical protein
MGLESHVVDEFRQMWEHNLAKLMGGNGRASAGQNDKDDEEDEDEYVELGGQRMGTVPVQMAMPGSMARAQQQAAARRVGPVPPQLARPPGYDGPCAPADSDSEDEEDKGGFQLPPKPILSQEQLHSILSSQFRPSATNGKGKKPKMEQTDGPLKGSSDDDEDDEEDDQVNDNVVDSRGFPDDDVS